MSGLVVLYLFIGAFHVIFYSMEVGVMNNKDPKGRYVLGYLFAWPLVNLVRILMFFYKAVRHNF